MVEYRGYWWRPVDPQHRVPGVLTFRPGARPRLELLGSFFAFPEAFQRQFGVHSEPIILGDASTDERITLVGCSEFPGTPAFGSIATPYEARYLLVGQHFNRPEDVVFASVELSFTNMDAWTRRHGFHENRDGDPAGRVDVRYERPPDVTATAGGFEIAITHQIEHQRHGLGERRLIQSTLLRITAPQLMPLEAFLNGPVMVLRSLFAFATSSPTHPLGLQVYLNKPPTPDTAITVFCNTGAADERTSDRQIDVVFVLDDIVDRFADVLQQWFTQFGDDDALRAVMELYLGTLYGERMFIHHQFLSLAQALESLHRRAPEESSALLMPPTDLSVVKDMLIAALPETVMGDTREELAIRIGRINQPTFLQCLLRLVDDAPSAIRRYAIPDPSTFAKAVRSTRNYHTHHSKEDRNKAAEGIDLLNLMDQMWWLLTGLFLKRLNLPEERVERILQGNTNLRRLPQWRMIF